MFKNRYRTNQARVDANISNKIRRVVMLRVSVKLLDRNEKSHVGIEIVTKVMIQYSKLGTIVNMPSSSPPSMPTVPGDVGAAVVVVSRTGVALLSTDEAVSASRAAAEEALTCAMSAMSTRELSSED
jgi:hypothetical protein